MCRLKYIFFGLFFQALTKKKEQKVERYEQGHTTISQNKRVLNSYSNSTNSNPDDF